MNHEYNFFIEATKLVTVVLLPFLIALLVTLFIYTRTTKKQNRNFWKWLKINDGNLSKQPIFWLAIALPCLGFLVSGVFVWADYKPLINAKGFQTFIEISKLPLAILSFSIPLGVLVSRIHSTKQTESTGERDQKKLNQIYYEGARSHFIIQMNAHWRAVLKICPELADIKELEFDAEEVFFTCFYDSSPIDGIQQPIQHWEQTILDLLNSKRPKLEKNKAMRLWGGLLSQKEDIMKDHIDKLTEDGIRYLAQWIQTECNRVSQRFAHDYSPSKVPKLKKAQTE